MLCVRVVSGVQRINVRKCVSLLSDLESADAMAMQLTRIDLLLGDIPIFFARSGLTRELFDLIIEFRPTSTSGGLSERIKREH